MFTRDIQEFMNINSNIMCSGEVAVVSTEEHVRGEGLIDSSKVHDRAGVVNPNSRDPAIDTSAPTLLYSEQYHQLQTCNDQEEPVPYHLEPWIHRLPKTNSSSQMVAGEHINCGQVRRNRLQQR